MISSQKWPKNYPYLFEEKGLEENRMREKEERGTILVFFVLSKFVF